jgi:hypothetical protein
VRWPGLSPKERWMRTREAEEVYASHWQVIPEPPDAADVAEQAQIAAPPRVVRTPAASVKPDPLAAYRANVAAMGRRALLGEREKHQRTLTKHARKPWIADVRRKLAAVEERLTETAETADTPPPPAPEPALFDVLRPAHKLPPEGRPRSPREALWDRLEAAYAAWGRAAPAATYTLDELRAEVERLEIRFTGRQTAPPAAAAE